MKVLEKDVIIRKEGMYYTVYLGDEALGCADINDVIEWASEILKENEM